MFNKYLVISITAICSHSREELKVHNFKSNPIFSLFFVVVFISKIAYTQFYIILFWSEFYMKSTSFIFSRILNYIQILLEYNKKLAKIIFFVCLSIFQLSKKLGFIFKILFLLTFIIGDILLQLIIIELFFILF